VDLAVRYTKVELWKKVIESKYEGGGGLERKKKPSYEKGQITLVEEYQENRQQEEIGGGGISKTISNGKLAKGMK